MIQKLKLVNFKKFKSACIKFNDESNIFVGENGVGKSSLLQAISLVLSGSNAALESEGLSSLFNVSAIKEFMSGEKTIETLPKMEIELTFDPKLEKDNFMLNGKKNSEGEKASGLKLFAEYNDMYADEIREVLESGESFPFEYYKVQFKTFAGKEYSSFNRFHHLRYDLIDTSTINTDFALKKYVRKLYHQQATVQVRSKVSHEFREVADSFSNSMYTKYKLDDSKSIYKLRLDVQNDSDFSEDITAVKEGIKISNIGMGEQVLLSVEASGDDSEDDKNKSQVLLIEEPENHLSYNNMQRLIKKLKQIKATHQVFIATHNNMIASRLDISNLIVLDDNSGLFKLSSLKPDTVKFFQKAPSDGLLNFILSKKAILVEGDAEYMLLEHFYKMVHKNIPFEDGVSIISCGGKTFKRYLDVAIAMDKKVAVITDNDEKNKDLVGFRRVEDVYREFDECDNIHVFTDPSPKNYTFEVALYNNNCDFYENNFKKPQMKNGFGSYMLNNKSEAAYNLLNFLEDNSDNSFEIPGYIQEAIKWIKP